MKNLKRALSFAVAAVMLIGMMAIGTSAFTDDAAIENTTAVNVMNQLGIIAGKPDGSFDPTATVTRGEMAKMICVALNGGKDPILDTATSSYPDTVGHWAAGYIEYCTAMGIVAGSTDGNFYPNAPITGTEAAKMVLIAIGYNAKSEGFVNNKDWSTNINIVAANKGLYEDVTSLPGAAISRDNAAQMLYNGMNTDQVSYRYDLNAVDGNLTSVAVAYDDGNKGTVLEQKFDMSTLTAVLVDVVYDAEEDEYTYEFDTNLDNGLEVGTVDYSGLFMQEVTVLYKDSDDAGKDKLYGMYGNGAILATGLYGDLGAYDAEEEGVEFGDTYVAAEGDLTTAYAYLDDVCASPEAYYDVAVMDYDGDGNADYTIVYPFTFDQVSFVGKTYANIGGQVKYEDHDVYAGVAVEDWVKIVDKDNTLTEDKNVYTKLETVAGTFTAKKGAEYKMGNDWYTLDAGVSVALNTEYNLIVVGNYVLSAEEPDAEAVAVTDVVYVVDVDSVGTGFNKNTQKVKVMYTDGTTAIVTAVKVNSYKVGADVQPIYSVAVDAGLMTYEVDDDGNYELTAFDGADFVGGEIDDANEGKFYAGSEVYRLNDDVVLFVVTDDEASVVKAADANKWVDADITGNLFGEKKNGFVYAQIGLVFTDAEGAESDASYGLVVDEYYVVADADEEEWIMVSVWNGTETVELTIPYADGTVANLAIGQLITWVENAEGEIEVEKMVATAAAVTAYDGTLIAIDGIEYDFADDAVILYVDSDEVAGYAEGAISVADKDESDFINNIYVITSDVDNDAAEEITVLVVEVNNVWNEYIFAADAE